MAKITKRATYNLKLSQIYNQNKKKSRNKPKPPPIGREAYDDIDRIRSLLIESEALPDNLVIPIRVRLVKTDPVRCYRASFICNSKEKRCVKNKEGRSVLVFAGNFINKTWWVEKTPDGFVFTPTLREV